MTRLAMLPGAYFQPGDFAANGFIEALHSRHPAITPLTPDLPPHTYLDGTTTAVLHDLIAPHHADESLWLLGISLGGLGALLYDQAYPNAVAGLILIAPFLGSRGLVAEVLTAGGLNTWEPGPLDDERRLIAGLKTRFPRPVYLGYGIQDRFAPASRLLAANLPPDHVIAQPGNHDWTTWHALWSALLDRCSFEPA